MILYLDIFDVFNSLSTVILIGISYLFLNFDLQYVHLAISIFITLILNMGYNF